MIASRTDASNHLVISVVETSLCSSFSIPSYDIMRLMAFKHQRYAADSIRQRPLSNSESAIYDIQTLPSHPIRFGAYQSGSVGGPRASYDSSPLGAEDWKQTSSSGHGIKYSGCSNLWQLKDRGVCAQACSRLLVAVICT